MSGKRIVTINFTRASAAVALVLTAALVGGCGGSSLKVGTPAGTASATGTTLKGDSNSRFCTIALAEQAQEDKIASEVTGDSPQDLEKFEQQALNQLPAFVSAAPAAIKGDVQTLVAAEQKFFTALKAANFDYTKLDPTVISGFEDPQFTKAASNVSDYLEQVCGINPSDDSSS